MMSKFKTIPVAFSGLALGILGLSSSWSLIYHQLISLIGLGISCVLLLFVFIKNVFHPSTFVLEIKHPVLGSYIPTLDMSLMIIASIIHPWIPETARILWLTAIVAHVCFMSIFFYFQFTHFKFSNIIPSWFIPPIGIVVACVSSSQMNASALSTYIFYFGLISYTLLLPIIAYRILFGTPLKDDILPSFGIMAAPANLCLAGYLTCFSEYNIMIILYLASLGILSTCLVYISLIRILRIRFTPLYASFTFPLSIGITARIKLNTYIQIFSMKYVNLITTITYIELFIATIMISYIFLNMLLWMYHFHKKSHP